MADETTLTTANDVVLAATIEEAVKEELGARVVLAPLCRVKDLTGTGSHVWNVPIWTALTTGVAPVAEGTDLANEAVSMSAGAVTASEAGVMTTVTDKLMVGNVIGPEIINGVAQMFGRNMARSIDVAIAALFAAFNGSTAVGTTTADATESDFLDGIYTLEVANATGQKVFACHPRQAADLRADMFINAVTTSGALPGHVATLDHNQFGFSSDDNGYWTTLYNVPCFISDACPLVNTNADRAGAMFIANSAIGLAYHWLGRIEMQRDASVRGTEVVCTSDYGVAEIEDGEGVPFETDA